METASEAAAREAGLDLEAGRLLFAGPIDFTLAIAKMEQLPDATVPEVAFAGRSNVGKSSLINAIAGRKALARSSSEPGRTKELIYFNVGERLNLVDMPGYGYAKASKTDIARWQGLMRDFLRGRPGLSRVFLLIDGRHGLKPSDIDIMDGLDRVAVVYQVVLTKIDKLKGPERARRLSETQAATARRVAAHPRVLMVSAHDGDQIDLLRAEIEALANPPLAR
jgi:GTP-binding protein